jgi:hypothetical protein
VTDSDAVRRGLRDLGDIASKLANHQASMETLREKRDRIALMLNEQHGVPLRRLAAIVGTTDSYLSGPRIRARMAERKNGPR